MRHPSTLPPFPAGLEHSELSISAPEALTTPQRSSSAQQLLQPAPRGVSATPPCPPRGRAPADSGCWRRRDPRRPAAAALSSRAAGQPPERPLAPRSRSPAAGGRTARAAAQLHPPAGRAAPPHPLRRPCRLATGAARPRAMSVATQHSPFAVGSKRLFESEENEDRLQRLDSTAASGKRYRARGSPSDHRCAGDQAYSVGHATLAALRGLFPEMSDKVRCEWGGRWVLAQAAACGSGTCRLLPAGAGANSRGCLGLGARARPLLLQLLADPPPPLPFTNAGHCRRAGRVRRQH